MRYWLVLCSFMSMMCFATPHELFPLSTPAQQQQFSRLTSEVRCLICQNETIADSNAPIARNLKAKVYEMVKAGNSDQAIKTFLVERYGDFVLFKPRFTKQTLLLWAAPILFLVLGFSILLIRIRRANRVGVAQ